MKFYKLPFIIGKYKEGYSKVVWDLALFGAAEAFYWTVEVVSKVSKKETVK